ncbi:magnesium protoporphyrin IX methyltransferase [Rhizobium sp. AAP43]|uniref:magnesium protoporphyrin IX methyltransferase n=1 Tax=Rhizobium sp. AAP43 TaxID=1523420 RepID=UPI0006B8A69E|nr:magnesium protoporphyrin IX methyltransferase [Rhizobium sp. AAP43]KPF43464.1 SAM-dependent methyltransferase [Rhizobium sp. AAP43]
MSQTDYIRRTGEIEHYFDRTALDAWKRLTGDQPVSGIRATVRKGRDDMRQTLVSWLPADLTGWRILDAGCGSGVLSFELMRRGAEVVAVDLSAQMVAHARQRAHELEHSHGRSKGSVTFHSGDMLDPRHGSFDAVVSMDVLIHYRSADAVRVLHTLAERCSRSMLFTLAPGSRLLRAMLAAGQIFPRGNRAPAIYPVEPDRVVSDMLLAPALSSWTAGRSHKVSVGFYTSQAMEVIRS